MKLSRLSVPNIVLTIVCIISIITVILLNAINSAHLSNLKISLDSLGAENPTLLRLQESDKELSVAENNYRIFLATNDTTYRNAFLVGIAGVSDRIQQVISLGDSSVLTTIKMT